MFKHPLALARRKRISLTLTILTGLGGGILTIWQARLLSQAVSRVFLAGESLNAVSASLGLLLGLIFLRGVLAWFSEVSATAVAIGVKKDLRQRLFNHILQLGPAYTRGERSGALSATAVEAIEALDAYFSQYLPQLALSALIPLAILVTVFPLDPLSGLILCLTAPLIPIFLVLIGKAGEALTNQQYETLSRLSAHFLDSLQGLTTLKLLGHSKTHTATITTASEQFRDTTLAVLRVTFLSALVLELVATLSTAMIAVEIGLRLLYSRLTFEHAFFLLVIAPEFYLPLRMLGLRFHAGMAGTSAARQIFKILNTQPKAQGQTTRRGSDLPKPDRQPRIALRNVSYTYPDETIPALQDFSLDIFPGEQLALVGPSGAGKSTLIQLILGFITPDSGEILLEGRTLQEVGAQPWRKAIGWVPQNPHLFHETILENIRLGKPAASLEELQAASQAASLEAFIGGLPEGYETLIKEGGARLSSGQAQRLALGRAFLKDAPILILDEPTSSLDPVTESLLADSTRKLVQGGITNHEPGWTVITIAHRLNTIYQADRILVLEAGRLCESGSHEALLAQGRVYAQMMQTYHSNTAMTGVISPGRTDQTGSIPDPVATQTTYPAQLPLPASLQTYPPTLPDQATRPGRPTLSILVRLLSFIKGAWGQVTLSVLLGTATIASSIGLMGTAAWLISKAALHPSIAELQVAIVAVRTFGITRGLARYLERLVSHGVTFHLLARIRTWFYAALEPLAPARLMDFRSGDLLSRAVSDVETLENFYVRVVAPPLTALLVASGTAAFLGCYDPRLAWTLLVFTLALGAGLPLLAYLTSRSLGSRWVGERAELQAMLVDGIQGLADLLAFDRAEDQAAKIQAAGESLGAIQQQLSWLSGLVTGLGVILANLGMWAVLVLSIPLISRGQMDGVMLAVLAMVTLASFEAVTPLPLAAQMLGSTTAAGERLFGVIDVQAEVTDPPEPAPAPAPAGIRIANLTFNYPSNPQPALVDVQLGLTTGKVLAVVGPSGVGKSTLANLLLRFWDYDNGRILLDGRELKSYAQDDVRALFAVVPHNPYFFNTTIRENLLLANPGAGDREIETAAKAAQIHDFILTLPQGYHTPIGEQGTRLSGGERQRLGIARALLKAAPILVLDEPTANLDPLTERQVLDALFTIMRDRTALLITHRLVGLDGCDEILVLDQGRIVQRGQQAVLLAQDGLYRRMWEIQNRILNV
jgi:ATP-binding cassette subfamily C protein CydCD